MVNQILVAALLTFMVCFGFLVGIVLYGVKLIREAYNRGLEAGYRKSESLPPDTPEDNESIKALAKMFEEPEDTVYRGDNPLKDKDDLRVVLGR